MKKKKILLNILVLLICAGIAVGCFFIYKDFTTRDKKSSQTKEPDKEVTISSEPLFEEGEYPKVDGSTATIPLAKAFEENFTGKTDVEINHSMTHEAYLNLVDGGCDLILVVEPAEDDKAYAESKNVELQYDKVANEGFVFFVNSDNPVESLTIEQIQKIYSGEITNWSEVGGNDEEIMAYQRPVNSGSQTAMENLVMKDVKLKPATTEDIADSMFDIVDVVSDYNNGINSIGYSYYYFANTMYLGENVKMLKVEGVAPNNSTITAEKYPIMTAYYAVTRKTEDTSSLTSGENATNKTRKLLDAMLSPRGQQVVEKAGYVPIF